MLSFEEPWEIDEAYEKDYLILASMLYSLPCFTNNLPCFKIFHALTPLPCFILLSCFYLSHTALQMTISRVMPILGIYL